MIDNYMEYAINMITMIAQLRLALEVARQSPGFEKNTMVTKGLDGCLNQKNGGERREK